MGDGEEGFDGDQEGANTTTSFSQLLFADEDVVSFDMDQSFYFNATTSTFTERPPKMLCFGSDENEDEMAITTTFSGNNTRNSSTPQNSKVTKSSPTCSPVTPTTLSKSNRKRNGAGQKSERGTRTLAVTQISNKRAKTETPTPTGFTKVRKKEKLGERIAALQHLVSPFGKADTASVLHEATGYIKFLQDQVQVLCSPYLQHHPTDGGGEESSSDLKSRGLCMVPLAYTVHVVRSNGADFWSSSVGNR